ncbi:hypothetical protein CR513_39464, partial [Mucuna pruriens]
MNKIRNSQDNATSIITNVQATLDQHLGSTKFQNKSFIAKANQAISKGVLTYCASIDTNYLGGGGENKKKIKNGKSTNDSPSTSINDDDMYYDIVGGKNGKGNVYGHGELRNKFTRSTRLLFSLIGMPMVEQLKEMRETFIN